MKNILKISVSIVLGLCVSNSLAYADIQKLTYDDVAGKNYYSVYNGYDVRTKFYSNMNFKVEADAGIYGWQETGVSGEWAIENGVIATEGIPYDDVNKTMVIFEPDFVNEVLFSTESGRGEITAREYPIILPVSDDIANDIIPPYNLTTSEIQGKKITIGSEVWYFFNNMTCIVLNGTYTTFMGTWKIEKGVLVIDGGWEERDSGGTITDTTLETTSSLYDAVPAVGTTFDVWMNAQLGLDNTDINIDAISDITSSDTLPAPFNNDLVLYKASVANFAGKTITFEYSDAGNTIQSEFIFNENMTFRKAEDLLSGNPDISTGIWSVEEGVVILDTVYSDHYVRQDAIIFSEQPKTGAQFEFIGIEVSDAVDEGEGIGIVAHDGAGQIVDYPSDGTLPAIIMYLLN